MPSLIRRRTLKDGTHTYAVQFPAVDQDGNTVMMYSTFEKRKDADSYLCKLKNEREAGGAVRPSNQMLGAYLDEWLDAVRASLRPATVEGYRDLLKRHVRPALGGVALKKLTTPMIQRKVYATMTENGLSPRTVRYVHAILHRALNDAVRWRKITRNPSTGATVPRDERRDLRVFTLAEARAFLEVVAGDPLEALFHVLLSGGLRPSEAYGLRWAQDVDLAKGQVTVRHGLTRTQDGAWHLLPPKTKAGVRAITLPAPAVAALKRHQVRQSEARLAAGPGWNPEGFAFVSVLGEPLEHRNVAARDFKAALKRLGAKLYPSDKAKREELLKVRLYDLRHSCATLALAGGANVKAISERLGHTSVAFTLDVYVTCLETMQADATDRLSEALYGSGG